VKKEDERLNKRMVGKERGHGKERRWHGEERRQQLSL
jgi:hypothetical protein